MHITVEHVLAPDVITALYPTYLDAWDALLVHAAARHVLSPEEFELEMTDPRIDKYVVREVADGPVLGLTTLTNEISAIPWINAHHYVARYPDAAARGALFYLGYTFVDRGHRNSQALILMAEAVNRRLMAAGGVAGFDICAFNNEHGIGRRVARLFSSSDRIDSLDTQSYYAADYQKLSAPSARTDKPNDIYDVVTLADHPSMVPDIWDLLGSRWPTFTLAGRAAHGVDLERMLLTVPEQQVLVTDAYGELCGVGLSVPLRWDGTTDDLPAGWDDAIVQSSSLLAAGAPTNTICALSVTIAEDAGGRGLAERVMTGLAEVAASRGASALITPVRPNLKSRYPLVSMQSYLSWRNDQDEVFDPWLRLHLRMGATTLGVAASSMTVGGSIKEWEEWLSLPLPGSGSYVISGGLVPLQVDAEADWGVYCEPNVWVQHRVASSSQR